MIKDMMKFEFRLVKLFIVTVAGIMLASCGKLPKLDDVLPDTRDTYESSQSLPDLEVPPDLTLEDTGEMAIPGEDEEPATLSEFERMKRVQRGEIEPEPVATTTPSSASVSTPTTVITQPTQAPDPDTTPTQYSNVSGNAEILNVGDNKLLLVIPEEYLSAWNRTERLILGSGLIIDNRDQSKGLYYITYTSSSGEEEEKGLFSNLKFWGDDEPQGKSFRISLTGVGSKTEVVVLNSDGFWDTSGDAGDILLKLQQGYNQ